MAMNLYTNENDQVFIVAYPEDEQGNVDTSRVIAKEELDPAKVRRVLGTNDLTNLDEWLTVLDVKRLINAS